MATSLVTLTTIGTLVVPASLAAAGGVPSSAPRVQWAYTDAERPDRSFVDTAGAAPVGKWQDEEGNDHRSRSYFTYDISRYAGKVIQAASFIARETQVDNCTRSAPVELWKTGPLGGNPTWRTPPTELHQVGVITMGGSAECADLHVFDVTSEVRAAVAAGQSEVTFGLRIAASHEGKAHLGRRFRPDYALSATANTPPATPTGLTVPSRRSGCGSADEPIYVGGNPTFTAQFSDADANYDWINATFAWWPLSDEAARQEVVVPNQPAGSIRYQQAWENPMPERRYGWAARSNDGYHDSAWSHTCYFEVDRRVPNRPVVTSDDYPNNGERHGGPGVPGTFRVDPNGSGDVVAYRWSISGGGLHEVAAPQLGVGIEIEAAPTSVGTNILTVQSIDRTGNRSSESRYEFGVRNTAPQVDVELNGVDLPSVLTMRPGVAGIVEYRYRIGDGAEVTVPAAADGTATAEVYFTTMGTVTLTVASYTATGLAGAWSDTIRITDAPRATSAGYDGSQHHARVAEPFTLNLRPGRPGVVRYEYQLDWDQPVESVPAGADGAATVTWTPSWPGNPQVVVWSVQADGTRSESAIPDVLVIDARPYVSAFPYNADYPSGGVGVEGVFWIQSDLPDVAEFLVRLNDGAEFTTPAHGGNSGELTLAPDRVGENLLTVRSRYLDGTLSPAREWTFLVAG